MLLLLGAAAWQAGRQPVAAGQLARHLAQLERTPILETVLAPVSWFIKAATAERVWPDLVQWSALSLLVNLALLALVFALDAHYLEAAAAASEKAYARLERLRRGTAAIALPTGARPRMRLPGLPYWGGVGPLLWRQLTTALPRSPWALVLVVLVFGVAVGPAWR